MQIDFEYGLFGKLRATSGQTWTNYVRHPFVRQLAAGTLPEVCFKRFLTQDYLFLIHYARAYGLLASKGRTLSEIRAAASSLGAILGELPVHVGYCKSWGLTEADMESAPEASETMTYTRYVLDIGQSGDILELTAALMPCVAGYGEIGQIILQDEATVMEGNPYEAWIRNYESEEYLESVDKAIKSFDEIGKARGSEARMDELVSIFNTATRLEADFWQMGLNAAKSQTPMAAE